MRAAVIFLQLTFSEEETHDVPPLACRATPDFFMPGEMDIPENCLYCGVCCFAKSGTYVRVSESDWLRLGEDAEAWARRVGGQAYMRMDDGHCLALQITTPRGKPPVFFCGAPGRAHLLDSETTNRKERSQSVDRPTEGRSSRRATARPRGVRGKEAQSKALA